MFGTITNYIYIYMRVANTILAVILKQVEKKL